MRYFFITVLISFFFTACINEKKETQHTDHDLTAKVIHLKDGDSFIVLDDQNNKMEVRLIDMDAPELHQAHGRKAKEYLSNLIKGKTVGIDYEKKDKYNRLLAYAYLDTLNLNEEMIRAGYAWHFTRFSDDQELQSLEDEARKNKLGLWQDKNPQAPWDWRDKKPKNEFRH